MKSLVRTIGLILLGMYPACLSAQVVSNSSPTPSANDVTPVVYQAPAAPEQKATVDASRQEGPATTGSLLPPLKPKGSTGHTEPGKLPNGLQSFMTVGGSLAVVLGIFFVIVWLLRRASPGALGTLPSDAFEVLGRAPLAHHQQVHLLRCGNKLLLVSVTATGAATLAEIGDPAEVDRLTGLCRQSRPGSAVAGLRQVFRQTESHHA